MEAATAEAIGKMLSFLKCAPLLAPKPLKRHDLEESTLDINYISISYHDQGKSCFFTCQAPRGTARPMCNKSPLAARAAVLHSTDMVLQRSRMDALPDDHWLGLVDIDR